MPFRALALPELFWDRSIQFVQVSLFHAASDRAEALLELFALCCAGLINTFLIRLQSPHKLLENAVRDMDYFEDVGEPIRQLFLPKVGQIALPAMAGTVIVNVLPSFNFSSYRAIIIGAGEQAAERKLPLVVLRFVMVSERGLDAIE